MHVISLTYCEVCKVTNSDLWHIGYSLLYKNSVDEGSHHGQTDTFETRLLFSLSSAFQQINSCPTLQEFGIKADGKETQREETAIRNTTIIPTCTRTYIYPPPSTTCWTSNRPARAHHFLLALPLPRSNPTRYKYPAQSCHWHTSFTCLWRWNRQWVPKRRQLELRRRGITQKGTNYI